MEKNMEKMDYIYVCACVCVYESFYCTAEINIVNQLT